jgi:2-polyprenyl-3-methyl-5-hydroxy-6-metoxy-1,4-benzoquinol methylase
MKCICEICDSSALLPLDEKYKGVDIVACNNCGLVWNRNMAEEREQLEFYQKHNRPSGAPSRRYLISMLSRAACAVDFMGDDLKPGMRHLDVGCADGTLLSLTRSKGARVQGLELDLNFSQFAREVRNLDVLPMVIDDAPVEPESLDLISFVHVVEHLFHPTQVLGAASKLLRPEGLLYVEVPNLNQPLPGLRHFFRPKHNYYFSANSLRAVVAKAGYTPLRLGYSPRDSSLQLLAVKNKAGSTDAPDLSQWKEDARKIRSRVSRERHRHYLLLRLLVTRTLRQRRAQRMALQRFGQVVQGISATLPLLLHISG